MTASAMRILVISNFYPPHVLGGYELGCGDVVSRLEARGHSVNVLTSCHGTGEPATDLDGRVFRWLRPVGFGASESQQGRRALLNLEVRNQLAFDRLWRSHRPDVIYLWNLARLPLSIALRAEARAPVCYYVSDQWLARRAEPGWYEDRWHRLNSEPSRLRARMAAAATRTAFGLTGLTWTTGALALDDVQFCSAFLRDLTLRAGRHIGRPEVVHWGVDTGVFTARDAAPPENRMTRLLYVGQILPHKGVHTAIEALGHLHRSGARHLSLTIVGASHDTGYMERLREQTTALGLNEAVRFPGPQKREQLPAVYRDHDILIFPSSWDEPFAITPLEAMASGLAIVGTLAGGSGEIFEDGVNALTFPQGDAGACAERIGRLVTGTAFARALAERGRRTVVERFTLEGMVDRIETHLHAARARQGAAGDGVRAAYRLRRRRLQSTHGR